MTNENIAFTQQEVKDFKQYYGQAISGVMASIPFGVTVDPNQLATIGSNIATAMVYVQRDSLPEELHEDEKSNFGTISIYKADVARVVNALIAQDRGLAAKVLSEFNAASVDKLDPADYGSVYTAAVQLLDTE